MASLEQLEAALRAADAAGNQEDAARLAQAYAQARKSQSIPASQSPKSAQSAPVSRGNAQPSITQLMTPAGLAGALIQKATGDRTVTDFADAVQHRFTAPFHGAAQGVEHGLSRLGVISPETVASDDAALRQRDSDFQARTQGSTAARVGGFLGDAGAAVALTRRVPLPAKSTIGRLASGAASGGLLGAAQPIVGDDQSRLENTGIGALLGLAGQGGSDALLASGKAAASRVSPAIRDIYESAKRRGVDLMPWQLAESPFMARARGVASAVPFSGAKKRVAQQSENFDHAVAKEIGETLGKGETLTPDVMGRAYDRMGSEFDRLFSAGVNTDRQFLRDVATLRQEAHASGNQEAISAVEKLVDRVRNQGAGGSVSGKVLQSLDRQARKLQQSGDPDRIAVGEDFRDALHSVFGRNAPAGDRSAFDAVRRQYANYKTVEPVVARTGGMAPAQLLGAVNATKAGRARMARGQGGGLGELARIGQQMKPAQTSGTAENLFSGGALLGGAVNLPLTLKLLLAGNVGGRALDSDLLARYLMSQGRGQGRQLVAPYLRPAPLAALPYQAAAAEGKDVRP